MQGNPRSIVTTRSRGKQRLRTKIYLVLEGEETEKKYFREIANQNNVNYTFKMFNPGSSREKLFKKAISIVDELRDEAKELGRKLTHKDVGEVWIVCDVDDEGSLLKELQSRKESKDLRWIISNPSFDIWLGMHFDGMVTGYMHRGAIQSKLKKMKVLTGSKSKTVQMDLLQGNYRNAKRIALSHDKRHLGVTEFPGNNPSSNVHELIDVLNPEWE